jgi:type IV secretion system protein VirB2
MLAGFQPGTESLADPPASSVLLGAVVWLQGTLLGTVATVTAVIAVATIGFLMMTGRIAARRAAVVVLGCFILFGAASIVGGIRASLGGGTAVVADTPPAPAPRPAQAEQRDPYAGASVPPE